MIKAIILDVDGVIVGEKIGYNSPNPHKDVLQRLKDIRTKGTYIILCTAKPHYSIQKIIDDAGLNNLHITNGGGVVIDTIDNVILRKYVIEKELSERVIKAYLDNKVYVEFYSINEYFMQMDQINELTDIHTHILQKKAHDVASLADEARAQDIVKIMPIAKNEEDKERLSKIFTPFQNDLTLSWGVHPIALPHQFGIITAKGISKKQAVLEIAQSVGVKSEEMLGVGDSTSDWQFIESCRYGAAMGNASEELKKLVESKGEGNSFIGKPVDENGIIGIFNYFNL
jgi:Cof subfamily protein (haloacid dehalogenase superfamily)